MEVTILPPSLEDLYLSQNASITCVATNLKSYEDVKFSWSRDQGNALDVTSGPAEKLENGLYRLTSTLKICADEWNSGEKFTCTVKIPEIQEPITRSIKKDIGRSPPLLSRPTSRPPSPGVGSDGLLSDMVSTEKLGEKGFSKGRAVLGKSKQLAGKVESTGLVYWESLLEEASQLEGSSWRTWGYWESQLGRPAGRV